MLNIVKVYPSKRLFGFIFTIKVDWWYGLHMCVFIMYCVLFYLPSSKMIFSSMPWTRGSLVEWIMCEVCNFKLENSVRIGS